MIRGERGKCGGQIVVGRNPHFMGALVNIIYLMEIYEISNIRHKDVRPLVPLFVLCMCVMFRVYPHGF